MNEKKVYTLEDIAKELGVSKTTVSRAISGKGRIGRETRERVLAFIKEHEYQPNVVAKALAQRKTFNIGLVMPLDYAATEFPFFKDCMNGICKMASKYNYDIIISMCDGENIEPIKRLVANRKVDGMILSRAIENSSAQDYFKESDMPYVVIGPSFNDNSINVDNDNESAAEDLTLLMCQNNIDKIALFGGKKSYKVTESRYRGVEKACEKLGKSMKEVLYVPDLKDEMTVKKAVDMALENKVDGIICMDDYITNLTYNWLKIYNIKIPDRIRIASLYDSHQLESHEPGITSVRFDTVRLGENACMKLLKVLKEDVEEETVQSEYRIIIRESTFQKESHL